MPMTAKRKAKTKKKSADEIGTEELDLSAIKDEDEEPSEDLLDALKGLVDHEAEAEEHASANKGKDEELDISSLKQVFDDVVKIEDARAALQWTEIECPHCGEAFQISVDPDDDGQDMVEDCRICCRPIQMTIEMEGDDANVSVFRE